MTQPVPFKEQLRALEQLQELDLKIDSLKKNQGALPGLLKTLDDSLHRLKTSVDVKKNAASEIEKLQRQAQAALDLNKDRLARSTTRLEAVQNSQEYAAVNKEIEQLNKMNVSLEEQIKKTSLELDGVNKEIQTLTTEYEKIELERKEKGTSVAGQNTQFDSEIGVLMKERTAFTAKVERRLLAQYDRVRAARGGLGIVPALGGRCKGCNMMVPPQLYNMIQRGAELHSCPSCHRILYIPVPAGEAVATDNGKNSEVTTG
ncbi:MAG: hypothetical protein A2428_12585 [Bdellovibrionales bacterium RIFOXYC1_FULL_54_43]|nr:MAG: hypothetical protein A2428_12585 [Bdellovibrionales bacterium RIFOXYC1_FULL_54_43]OFZ82191.1 MAG: hypothetical protein A2603_12335 [Bdellovibrionales bacterium RIFOXYD1_FULL_55_31]